MYLHRTSHLRASARRGVVLLVVLALLTLFAAVGVAFVAFSEQEGVSANSGLQAREEIRPNPDLLMGYMLGQLFYDPSNSITNVQQPLSAMQFNSLLVNMYGTSGNTPYNSAGRRHQANTLEMLGLDPYYLPNYQLRSFNGPTPPNGSFTGENFYGSLNPTYTYADHNNHYLGQVGPFPVAGPTSTVVYARSFVRNGPGGFNPYAPGNFAFWTTPNFVPPGYTAFPLPTLYAQKRATVMRPGPWDHPNFPPPGDAGGDVKNLPPDVKVWVNFPTNSPPLNPAIFADNDSYWVDLGFPDQTGPDGKRYRPLFAFFIMDLDNRVNLNAAGNIRGVVGANNWVHLSNNGFGPSEINLNKVLPLSPPGPQPPEVPDTFLGNGLSGLGAPFLVTGRYGAGPNDKSANSHAIPPSGFGPVLPHFAPIYSRGVDFDGNIDPLVFTPSQMFYMSNPVTGAVAGKTLGFDRFPRYVGGDANPAFGVGAINPLGYPRTPNEQLSELFISGGPGAVMGHPSLFDVFNPTYGDPGNRVFGAWNMEAILRHGGIGTDATVSDVRRLLPLNLSTVNSRRTVTTHSFDLDRPGFIPYTTMAAGVLSMSAAPASTLSGGPIPFQLAGLPPPPAPGYLPPSTNGDYKANWRSVLSAYGKLDLNQFLPDYPQVDTTTGRIPPGAMGAFNAAQTARQNMAGNIYLGLVRAAGARDPFGGAAPSPTELDALRYLAQLAANIVDYIDNDDYMTPFNWGSIGNAAFTAAHSGEWVFGTEVPRLVVNEIYAQATAPAGTTVNVWAELYNPLTEDPALRPDYRAGVPIQSPVVPGPSPRGGVARLQMPPAGGNPAYSIYEVLLTQANPGIRTNNRVTGDPDAGTTLTKAAGPPGPCIVNNFTDTTVPPPPLPNTEWVYAGGNYFTGVNGKNFGFYLLGPADGGGAPQQVPGSALLNTISKQEMQCTVPAAGTPITVMLRRLACPHLPPNLVPGPGYNPYVTVDYVENVVPNPSGGAAASKHSVGRPEPYMANSVGVEGAVPDQQQNRQNPVPALVGQPQHTFFMHNRNINTNQTPPPPLPAAAPPGPGILPAPFTYQPQPTGAGSPPAGKPTIMAFDWLVHLDRDLISPMELLHVSAYKPHELTQQFIVGANKFQHYAPWFDETLRLYRALEFFECRSRASGVANVTVQSGSGVTGGGKSTVPLVSPANLFNVNLSNYLNAPSGITPGNSAVWSITPGTVVLVDAGNPLAEERVTVLGPATGDPAGPTILTAYFNFTHGPNFTITVPFVGGRQPGKININTIWDREVFRALCDPQACNSFFGPNIPPGVPPDQEADTIYGNMLPYRPFAGYGIGFDTTAGTQWQPNAPFQSNILPGGGIGINNTLLASNTVGNPGPGLRRLFEPPDMPATNHPYRRYELMTKIANNLTVRSNVFAVWCTVGYFQVMNANGQLGPEIGRVDGKQKRHRFFTIIDRSAIDPWVQMNTKIMARASQLTGISASYDIALGVPTSIAFGGGAIYSQPQAILLGNTQFDPRRDYTSQVIGQTLVTPNPASGVGPYTIQWLGPPPTVLYWSIIE